MCKCKYRQRNQSTNEISITIYKKQNQAVEIMLWDNNTKIYINEKNTYEN